jgi:NADP-dependent 3-hydroxy acid dehydrogenase YdfG
VSVGTRTSRGGDLHAIELDVLSQESTNTAQKNIVSNGRIDVAVHNTGHMVFGPAEFFMPE